MTATTRTLICCIIGFLLLVFCIVRFGPQGNSAAALILEQQREGLETKHRAEIAKRNGQIEKLMTSLVKSEQKATAYREKLAAAEKKLQEIVKPETATEAKQRLRDLGYEVR